MRITRNSLEAGRGTADRSTADVYIDTIAMKIDHRDAVPMTPPPTRLRAR
jgi:hypothetical protein